MNKKIIKILSLFIICFCLAPSLVSAVDIRRSYIWKNNINSKGETYYTRHVDDSSRTTSNIVKFYLSNGNDQDDVVFCVQPTRKFDNSPVKGYSASSSVPSDWSNLSVKDNEADLLKIFSCWDNNNNDIIATQALVWELVSGERYKIDETAILKNANYTPYTNSNGSIYRNGSKTLYSVLSGYNNLNNSYKKILRCAARFNVKPSFSYSSSSQADSNKKLMTYDDDTQTWSYEFKNSESGVYKNILKFYTQKVDGASGVNITNTGTSIKISTKNVINASSPARVVLSYAYKDNGSGNAGNKLNTNTTTYYTKSGYQALAKGSTARTYYVSFYTGPKPKYQLKIKKLDEDKKYMEGVEFNIFDEKGNKVNSKVLKTDKNGEIIYKDLPKVGKYTAKEASIVDGHEDKTGVTMAYNVTKANRSDTGKPALTTTKNNDVQDGALINTFSHLKMKKRSMDSSGKITDLVDDWSGNKCTGTYQGPMFIVKQGNKYLKLKERTKDETNGYIYELVGTTEKIEDATAVRTCKGKFDILKATEGKYTIVETEISDWMKEQGMTLPQNPISKVCDLKKGAKECTIIMENGVTGVVFDKIDENGNLIPGGVFALQKKVNGIYKDILLKHEKGIIYSYSPDLKEEEGTYLLENTDGSFNVINLPVGEYRFVEKQAPEGYQAIKDKDSKATFTISDKGIFDENGNPVTDYYKVNMVNQKVKAEGTYDTAELIVTIITGRKVINYALVIVGLAALLIALIVLRKKFKK